MADDCKKIVRVAKDTEFTLYPLLQGVAAYGGKEKVLEDCDMAEFYKRLDQKPEEPAKKITEVCINKDAKGKRACAANFLNEELLHAGTEQSDIFFNMEEPTVRDAVMKHSALTINDSEYLAGACLPLYSLDSLSKFEEQEAFLKDIAILDGDENMVETCDYAKANEILTGVNSASDIYIKRAAGNIVYPQEFASMLYRKIQNAPEAVRKEFIENHLSRGDSRASVNNLFYTEQQREDALRKMAFHLSLCRETKLEDEDKWLCSMNVGSKGKKTRVESLAVHYAGHMEDGEWAKIDEEVSERIPWLFEIRHWEIEKDMDLINIAESVTEGITHVVIPLGLGIFAGIIAGPVALPTAFILSDLTQIAGEEATKVVIKPDYMAADALREFNYHAPYAVTKGVGLSAGPIVGGVILTGASFLECALDPSFEATTIYPRFYHGANCFYTAAISYSIGLGLGRFSPRLGRVLGIPEKPPANTHAPKPASTRAPRRKTPAPSNRETAPNGSAADVPKTANREPVAIAPKLRPAPSKLAEEFEINGIKIECPFQVAKAIRLGGADLETRVSGTLNEVAAKLQSGQSLAGINGVKPVLESAAQTGWQIKLKAGNLFFKIEEGIVKILDFVKR